MNTSVTTTIVAGTGRCAYATATSGGADGGAIYNGVGTLTLTNADFTGNSATASGGYGATFGGAIYHALGMLILTVAGFTGVSTATVVGSLCLQGV